MESSPVSESKSCQVYPDEQQEGCLMSPKFIKNGKIHPNIGDDPCSVRKGKNTHCFGHGNVSLAESIES